jgi:competence protein ComEC
MHPSRIFLIACCAFLGGVALASWYIIDNLLLWLLVVLGSMALLWQRPWALVLGVATLSCVVGMWRTQSVMSSASLLWDTAASKPVVSLSGYVDGDFETTATGGRYTFRVLEISIDGTLVATNDRILISGPSWIRPRLGQWLLVHGKIQHPKNFTDFDYIGYLAKEGIHATMYFPTYDVPERDEAPPVMRAMLWIQSRLATFRLALKDSIASSVPQPEAGYLAGILVGAKGNVSAELKDAFARTGTSHIVAISGYNITIIATLLMIVMAPLGVRRAYWISVAVIILFTILVGAGASVVRAAMMGVMAMTAQRLGRLNDASTALVFTAGVMCFYNPLVLRWDVGFQLSFLAFAGIVYVQPLLEPLVLRLVRWSSLASLIATTLAAQVMVLPLLLNVFGTLAVYTLPVNILVVPLVPVAMALGFVTAGAGLLWPLVGLFVGQVGWLVSALQLTIVQVFARLPYASLSINLSAAGTIAAYVALATWLISLYRGRTNLTLHHNARTNTGTSEAGRSRQGNSGGDHLPF